MRILDGILTATQKGPYAMAKVSGSAFLDDLKMLAEPIPAAMAAPALGKRNLRIALALFALTLLTLLGFQARFHIDSFGVSNAEHFLYQAESLLHGHLDLPLPPSKTDIVVVNGKSYIVYPPFPAVLLMPFVAIFGLSTSDVFFTTVIAALNMPLIFLLLEQVRENGLTRRVWLENLCITLLLYYGSINLWLSLGGRMWFTAHVLCMTCMLLSLLLAFRRHYTWSTVLLACAFFTRATALFGFVFLAYLIWQEGGMGHELERFLGSLRSRIPDWSAIPWRRFLGPAIVVVVMAGLFMARNFAVFGSPLEGGYAVLIHQRYPIVTTGPFCTCYVKSNIVANFFTFPLITFSGPYGGAFDRHPVLDMLNHGDAVSVFVTTPLFLLLFWRNRKFSLTRAALWVTIGLIVIAVLLFHAAGWYQFGARYLYDGYAYAFLLLALSDVRVDWRFAALGTLGMLINVLGAAEFWTGHIFHL
jgi:hypothetical protein